MVSGGGALRTVAYLHNGGDFAFHGWVPHVGRFNVVFDGCVGAMLKLKVQFPDFLLRQQWFVCM